MEVKPFKNEPGSRKEQVREMFDRIAKRYDFLNHLLSFNQDKQWRTRVFKMIMKDLEDKGASAQTSRILDIATGTGDLAFKLSELKNVKITGLDLSEEMVRMARKKELRKAAGVEFIVGDSEDLPFKDAEFEYATVAFGIRNFENLQQGLQEMKRILKPGGKIFILEFSKPGSVVFSILYKYYSNKMLPFIASLFTREPRAYKYLPESINAFPEGDEMIHELEKAGFTDAEYKKLSRGISTIYSGRSQ